MHPYEVSQTLRSRAKQDSIKLNFGSLYNVVDGLEARGLIRALETVREGRRPERTVYELTEPGIREMNEWLSELVATPVKEFLQFEAALSLLGGLPPDEALAQLQARAEALEMRVALVESNLDTARRLGLPRLFALEGEYELALQRAELEWVRELVVAIDKDELDGLDEWRSWYEPGERSMPHNLADIRAARDHDGDPPDGAPPDG
jgi:DNA-binding PadR family transcriptional regulator